ncbi:MAG: PilZ domain-containing protein [Nitrospira sp.]|nr:hypothetical protein [Candidatus Manganitrophaceae bacterium]HIL33867.1 hypothetical protein [Candidatus Manganitrophaceae bacterium]
MEIGHFDIKVIRKKQNSQRFIIEYFVRFGVGGLHHGGLTMNLSYSGMFIKSSVIFPAGTNIEIEASMSDGYKASTGGIVVWTKDIPRKENDGLVMRGMGVRILSAPRGYQIFIENHAQEG